MRLQKSFVSLKVPAALNGFSTFAPGISNPEGLAVGLGQPDTVRIRAIAGPDQLFHTIGGVETGLSVQSLPIFELLHEILDLIGAPQAGFKIEWQQGLQAIPGLVKFQMSLAVAVQAIKALLGEPYTLSQDETNEIYSRFTTLKATTLAISQGGWHFNSALEPSRTWQEPENAIRLPLDCAKELPVTIFSNGDLASSVEAERYIQGADFTHFEALVSSAFLVRLLSSKDLNADQQIELFDQWAVNAPLLPALSPLYPQLVEMQKWLEQVGIGAFAWGESPVLFAFGQLSESVKKAAMAAGWQIEETTICDTGLEIMTVS
ncbi:hypothetical protein BK816_03605 [Boudabousia tangfeifanii]|uniref:GHMP kinase C-terminal domain-containing protein n=1 Tax=Boudabousia tangfeifanii TaxID=1912795 RepID=A0A1D9MJM9_9ACTO|nr:hypothetical protein [Boudabousia tangfeifanii]AOZ72492.1 hypothetical protein BK816_03605 [Boudabousia tangfeifanii]